MMMSRLERRNVLDASVEPGTLGGRYYDDETRARGCHIGSSGCRSAMLASLTAGEVSGRSASAAGSWKVPVLNAWCGVPMRAAAATSALMIGVTAVSSVPLRYSRAATSTLRSRRPPVIGVLVGSRAGFWFGGRARVKWLKVLMACVLGAVSILYFVKSFR